MGSVSTGKKAWANAVLEHLVEFGFGPMERAKHLFDRHTSKVVRLCWAVRESPRATAQHIIEREAWVLGINAAVSKPKAPKRTKTGGFYIVNYCKSSKTTPGFSIGSECITIPIRALQAEMDGDHPRAVHISERMMHKIHQYEKSMKDRSTPETRGILGSVRRAYQSMLRSADPYGARARRPHRKPDPAQLPLPNVKDAPEAPLPYKEAAERIREELKKWKRPEWKSRSGAVHRVITVYKGLVQPYWDTLACRQDAVLLNEPPDQTRKGAWIAEAEVGRWGSSRKSGRFHVTRDPRLVTCERCKRLGGGRP